MGIKCHDVYNFIQIVQQAHTHTLLEEIKQILAIVKNKLKLYCWSLF